MAASGKPGVMIYFETARAVKGLDYETKGRLFEAITEYAEFGAVPEFDGVLSAIWPFVSVNIDRDNDKYEAIKAARAEAGRKGGKARAENSKQSQANEANATFDKQIKPTTTTTSATTSATTSTTTTTSATNEGLRDNEEMENGVTSHTAPVPIDNPDDYFERRKREQIAKLREYIPGGDN